MYVLRKRHLLIDIMRCYTLISSNVLLMLWKWLGFGGCTGFHLNGNNTWRHGVHARTIPSTYPRARACPICSKSWARKTWHVCVSLVRKRRERQSQERSRKRRAGFLNNAHRKPISIHSIATSLVIIRSIDGSIYYYIVNKLAVSFVHQEFIKKQRRPRCSANVSITFEQSVFKKLQMLKWPREG